MIRQKSRYVMVVEDDRLLALHWRRLLESAGLRVKLAGDAVQAIDAIDSEIPAVIVLDVMLPANSGFALLHELQSYSDTSEIPILLCTSIADQIDVQDVRPYGVVAVLDKTTLEPSELIRAVQAAIL